MKLRYLIAASAIIGIGGGLIASAITNTEDTAQAAPEKQYVAQSQEPTSDAPASPEKPSDLETAKPAPSSDKPSETASDKETKRPKKESSSDISLCPRTAYGSQKAVDTGDLILWGDSPWHVAGHQDMGWDFLDAIPSGSTIKITCGPATGTYKAVGHKGVGYQGGYAPSWFNDYDLVLQTCAGSGTGFTVAQKV